MSSTPVTHALDALNVPYRVFHHPGPVESLEQAARERGQSSEQVIRSIVFRVSQEEVRDGLDRGAHQVSWSALRKHLGVSRVTMASADELKVVTGYEIGAVSPFGLPGTMRILVDKSVFAPDERFDWLRGARRNRDTFNCRFETCAGQQQKLQS